MKTLLLLPMVVLPLLTSACAPVVVERPVRRTAYVARDNDRYGDRHRDWDRRDRRDVVVVAPHPYRPVVEIRYYTDRHGRYYIKNGRRIYVR